MTTGYVLPSRWLRWLFDAAEDHPGVYRATKPLWWARWRYLCWRGRGGGED